MNRFNLGLVGLAIVLITVFVYMYYSGSISFFTQSVTFSTPGDKKLIFTDEDGNLSFVQTSLIDTAINDTVKSLDDSLTPVINTKLDSSLASLTYMPRGEAYTAFQPKGEYVAYDKLFRLTTNYQKGANADKGGNYARYYKGRVGWAPWNDFMKDPNADQAYWEINKIPSSS